MKSRLLFTPCRGADRLASRSLAWGDMLPGKSSAIGTVPHAALKTQVVEYRDGDQLLEGYLAYDAAKVGKRPAVLIVHDWMGVGPYVQAAGRTTGAPGLRGLCGGYLRQGCTTDIPEAAGAQAGKYKQDRALFRSRLRAGYQAMLASPQADPARTAAIGYCFGGTGVLELARSGADLSGRGQLSRWPRQPGARDGKNIKAKVLILHGADDPFVPAEGHRCLPGRDAGGQRRLANDFLQRCRAFLHQS